MNLHSIDFGRLYREHMAAAGGNEKPPSAWDGRAAEMSRHVGQSRYVAEFVGRMDLTGAATLLDVGCGPGTIALALAEHMQMVHGLDYSAAMLEAMMGNAAERGLGNVVPILRSWEDDWSDVPKADIVVASRSTTVMDMADAIAKLHAKARQRVYLTSLAGGYFIDPELVAVVGRQRLPLPDYIYIVNILHGMGLHPRLDYIENESRLANTENFDDFARKLAFSLGELNEPELARLRRWFEADPERALRGGTPMRWAFVSWDTRQ